MRAERLDKRHARVRPVDQQQIDMIEPQLREALLDRAFEIGRREQRRLHFGGDDHLGALAGGAHALADFALVVVHLRGVDVAIADADRLLDDPRAVAPAQAPRCRARRAGCSKPLASTGSHQGVSHSGACGGLTTRMLVALSAFSSAISACGQFEIEDVEIGFQVIRIGRCAE